MKYLLIFSLSLSLFSCLKKNDETTPQDPNVETASADKPAEANGILPGDLPDEKKEADCDKKAKEAQEPAEIKLQGGDTGCSLDEVNKK